MKVLYFAWLRSRIGVGEETVEPPPEVATAADLMAWLAERSPGHAAAFKDPSAIRVAVNQQHVLPDAPLTRVEEIAFFPPVTGG